MFSSAQHGAWKVGDYTLHGSIGTESQWYVRLLGNAPSGQVAQIEVVRLTNLENMVETGYAGFEGTLTWRCTMGISFA